MPPSYDNPIGNPFESKSDKPVTPNFGVLAEEFLSPKEAASFMELEENPTSHVARPASKQPNLGDLEALSLESGMTADERAKFREAKELRETRNRLIKWADEFNIGDDEWVDENFTFLPDGSAICKSSLYLRKRGITYFPKGIKEVRGYLDLSDNQITKIENLPASVDLHLDLSSNQITKIENLPTTLGGSLDLSFNQITKIENLPAYVGRDIYLHNNQITKIENLPAYVTGGLHLDRNQITKIENLPTSVTGDIYLGGNPAKQMQAGVNIGEKLWLSSDQTELIQDAKDKGYKVEIF